MRALVQRVERAQVTVAEEVVGDIGAGLCVFLGVTHDDDHATASKMATKLAGIRLMANADGQGIERSVAEAGGEILVVSQFTLYGDTHKGRRPSWGAAARPELAEPLIEQVVTELRATGLTIATGRFRADMRVELVNDGPVTVTIEI